MSENIRGITFAEQAVTPADDAVVRRAILGDGTLTGCEISYSGSTLTMASGYIIACGRSFQVAAAQNWAVVDATSGFARLLITIDLTQTATEDTFNQIGFSIEYASAQDGFVDLIQEEINLSGTKYQIVAAVVSLGTGGITGIVSKLEKTESGGGLNFKVVGGVTQPASATENTIWVNTDVPITSYIFSAKEPEAPADKKDGPVWIVTGTESDVEFNALKKNCIPIYPVSAKQYIGETWQNKEAKSWQNGRWVDWWLGELYVAGDEYAGTTGGWVFEAGPGNTTAYGNKDASSITVGSSSTVANFDSRATHNNFVALERFAEVKVHFTTAKTGGSSTCVVKICIYDTNDTVVGTTNVLSGQSKTLSDQWHSVDVSGLPTGVYKVKIHALHTSSSKQYCYATFDEVRCV